MSTFMIRLSLVSTFLVATMALETVFFGCYLSFLFLYCLFTTEFGAGSLFTAFLVDF